MEKLTAVTYWAGTGEKLTVAWDPVNSATAYVYRVKSLERDSYIDIDGAKEVRTTETSFAVIIPFGGHFVPEVKAVDDADHSSSWAVADRAENAVVDGEPRGWWIYGAIKPPSGAISIETTKGVLDDR